ncbi:MAG TPA: hypothetical protein IAA23_02170 [Candidatus Helicobacter avistercoris]|nr:hypothetical protein [Candidatus Helicobacter avistercoris]
MKKVFTFLFFCFYCNQSYAWGWFDNESAEQEVEVKKADNNTKSFIGFSVGVGDLGLVLFNPRLDEVGKKELVGNSLEFALAIEGGFQRYTHEKVGYQAMFRGRFVYKTSYFFSTDSHKIQ